MRSIVLIIIVTLVLVSSSSAQFITFNPSYTFSTQTKANGMGEVGVSFTDENNYYFNPANLGLLAFDNKIRISGYLQKADFYFNNDINDNHFSTTVYTDQRISLGLAYSRVKTASKNDDYLTDPYMLQLTNMFQRFTVGLGVRDEIEFALGVTLNIIEERYFETTRKDYTFDVGFRLGYRMLVIPDKRNNHYFRFNPSIGFATVNNSREKVSSQYSMYYTMLQLPYLKRGGFSMAIAMGNKKRSVYHDYFSFVGAIEREWPEDYFSDFTKYGCEVTLFEILSLRAGQSNFNEYKEKGLSLQLEGIKKFLWAGKSEYEYRTLLSRLNLMFNFSRQKYEQISYAEAISYNHDYYEFIISFEL